MIELYFGYNVFGLHLRANRAIPGLQPSSPASSETPDLEIHLGASPSEQAGSSASETLFFSSSNLLESGEPSLRIWKGEGGFLHIDYLGGPQFWIDPDSKAIWAIWPDTLSVEDIATYLLGPVLGLVLRLRGVVCLHASAIALADRAVAFVGAEGTGKSTTAAAMARRGHSVISDDIVTLMYNGSAFVVSPAYPYISLWPESVEFLYGEGKTLPRFSENWDKRKLALGENRLQFEERPLPLGAIFLLGERTADPSAPFTEALPPRDAFVRLVADSYATSLLDKDMRAREFELLGRLLAAVPICRLRPHEDPLRIDRLCEVIYRTCNRMNVNPRDSRALSTA